MELMVARKFWVKLKDIGVLEMEEIYLVSGFAVRITKAYMIKI